MSIVPVNSARENQYLNGKLFMYYIVNSNKDANYIHRQCYNFDDVLSWESWRLNGKLHSFDDKPAYIIYNPKTEKPIYVRYLHNGNLISNGNPHTLEYINDKWQKYYLDI